MAEQEQTSTAGYVLEPNEIVSSQELNLLITDQEDKGRTSFHPDDPDQTEPLDCDDLDLSNELFEKDQQESTELKNMSLFKNCDTNTDKMTKKGKKAKKKLAKMMRTVTTQLGAEQSPVPTKWVVIWGAGLDLGTPKNAIVNFFTPSPIEVRMYVNKPYCSARFDSTSDAVSALVGMNGAELLPLHPVYMAFLGQEPPPEDRSILRPFIRQWPVGLTVIPDFISELEEESLLKALLPEQCENHSSFRRDILTNVDKSQNDKDGVMKNRTVTHFGYEFRYGTNDVDFENPMPDKIPDFLDPFLSRMITQSITLRKPEQLTMNHYLPGQGIPPHVDTHSVFETPILALSLCGGVIMDFRNGSEKVSVHVPRRSLLVMNDEARLLWTHGIASRSYDIIEESTYGGLTAEPREERLSLTFRLLKPRRVCECNFPHMCDSQKPQTIAEEKAVELENDLVHRVYENIAPHFSSTRHTPWPKVREFVGALSPGQTMLDVGCGNGKYFNLADNIYQVGTDMSRGLLEIARNEKSVDGVRANCLKLPFRDESFNAIICIAVLHHLSTKERRLDALREILRVLSHGGEALIYVWAKNQGLKEMKSNYARQQTQKAGRDGDEKESVCVFPLRNYSFLPIHDHSEDFRSNDVLVPWLSGDKTNNTVEHRFYHVFDRGELEDLIRELHPRPRISDSYYDQGNWCVRLQKGDHDD